MRKLSFVSLKQLAAPGLALTAAIALLAPSAARATPYVVTLTEQGGDVVASGSGALDLTDLTFDHVYPGSGAIWPSSGYIVTGIVGTGVAGYTGTFTGPSNFGSGNIAGFGSTSGDPAGIIGDPGYYGYMVLWVPQGYVSDTDLTNSATWGSASFASLGITPGTYTWTWGSGADQSFTLMVVNAVPEPAALSVFGLGVLLVGGFVTLRRREQLRA